MTRFNRFDAQTRLRIAKSFCGLLFHYKDAISLIESEIDFYRPRKSRYNIKQEPNIHDTFYSEYLDILETRLYTYKDIFNEVIFEINRVHETVVDKSTDCLYRHYVNGEEIKSLADEYGVSRRTISSWNNKALGYIRVPDSLIDYCISDSENIDDTNCNREFLSLSDEERIEIGTIFLKNTHFLRHKASQVNIRYLQSLEQYRECFGPSISNYSGVLIQSNSASGRKNYQDDLLDMLIKDEKRYNKWISDLLYIVDLINFAIEMAPVYPYYKEVARCYIFGIKTINELEHNNLENAFRALAKNIRLPKIRTSSTGIIDLRHYLYERVFYIGDMFELYYDDISYPV